MEILLFLVLFGLTIFLLPYILSGILAVIGIAAGIVGFLLLLGKQIFSRH